MEYRKVRNILERTQGVWRGTSTEDTEVILRDIEAQLALPEHENADLGGPLSAQVRDVNEAGETAETIANRQPLAPAASVQRPGEFLE